MGAGSQHGTPVEDRRSVVRIPAVRSSLRSKVLAGDAILDVPPPRSLVGDLLRAGQPYGHYGPPASGKSFLALDVALSVASSQPWQGKDVVDGPVVYVIAEDVPGTALRARAWRSRHQSLGNIHWLPTRVPLLQTELVAKALCDVVAEIAPALIVVDTLARTMVGSDKSSTRDMGLAVDALDRLRAVLGGISSSSFTTRVRTAAADARASPSSLRLTPPSSAGAHATA